ncbi:MAG: hypothetical protein EOR69_26890 [Mesorhizobium sp.]|nr:MAG: hypothetical protein EOR69_26890 [Mesorhizobium sp.]RWL95429.1 MAG: hypothetical protein EOR70_23005 [Mesorhizobium sp.]
MRPTNADRRAIREQQIEVCRDMIAWEVSHNWGDAVQLAHFSAEIIEEYKRLIATLQLIADGLRSLETSECETTSRDSALPQSIGESRVPLRSFEKDVQIPLQYLAAATLVHWQEIPEAVRSAIVETATTSGAFPDLPRTTSLHEQIARLVRYSGRTATNNNATPT